MLENVFRAKRIVDCRVFNRAAAALQRLAYEEIVGGMLAFRDIRARKAAALELRESQEEIALHNRLAQLFLTVADDELYGQLLDVVLQIMESKYGLAGYIDEQGTLVVPSLTHEI